MKNSPLGFKSLETKRLPAPIDELSDNHLCSHSQRHYSAGRQDWNRLSDVLAHRHGNARVRHCRQITRSLAGCWFTVAAAVVQTVTGVMLIYRAGWNLLAIWLLWSYVFYVLAFACWLPVAWLQIRMRDLATQAVQNPAPLPEAYDRCARWWFAVGWLAFIALLIVFGLMVAKPG